MSGSPLDDVTPDEEVAKAEWLERKQATYEDRIVKLVVNELGRPDQIPIMRNMARDMYGDPLLHFGLFYNHFPFFTTWLLARHVPFVYKDLNFPDFYNRFTKTRVFQTYLEARADVPEDWGGPVGFIFVWPKVKGGRGAMILHDGPGALQGRWLQVKVYDTVYTLERLVDFMSRFRSVSAENKHGDG
jgi:hypothetical protein